MKVLCKLLLYILYITGVYDALYSAVHPMKYLENDVMWYKYNNLYLIEPINPPPLPHKQGNTLNYVTFHRKRIPPGT